jgi:hypothetical protein
MTVDGRLEPFYETGTEGVIWAVYEDGKSGYEGLHLMEDGDHLTVWNDEGVVIFQGKIDLDREVGWMPFPWTGKPHEPGFFCKWIREEDGTETKPEECRKGHSEEWARERSLGQQAALGYWVHGIQRNWDPDAWARMFFQPISETNPHGLGFKARLEKK